MLTVPGGSSSHEYVGLLSQPPQTFKFDFNDYYDPAHLERLEQLREAAQQSRLEARASKAAAAEAAADAAAARAINDQAQKDANVARTVTGRASGQKAKAELAAAAASKMKEAMIGAARAEKNLELATRSRAEAERIALETEESAIVKAKAMQEARVAADRALEVSTESREAQRQSAARRAAAEEEERAMDAESKAFEKQAESLSADAIAKEAELAKCIRAAKGAVGTGKAWEQRTEKAVIAARKAHERTAAAAAKAAATAANSKAAASALREMFDKADAESDAVELKAAEDAKVTVELAALADQAAKEAEEADAAATAAEEAAEAAKHAMEAAVKARDDALIAKRLEEEAAEKAQEEAKAARLAEEVALEKQEEATKAAQLTQEICNQKTAFSRTQIADSEMKEAIAQAAEADVKAMEEEAKEAAILACEWAEEEAAAEAEAKAEAERLAREEEQRRKEAECLTGDGRREGNVRTTPTSAKYSRLSGPGLHSASLGVPASFWIEAFGTDGFRQPDGGDAFFVCIRCPGLGTRIRARVIDYRDGRYNVIYKPTTAGRNTISVSLMGEPLPGSPFTCEVSPPVANAMHCQLSGEALHRMVACTPGFFYVSFRDVLDRVAHAVDLEVCVVRLDDDEVFEEPPAEAPAPAPAVLSSSPGGMRPGSSPSGLRSSPSGLRSSPSGLRSSPSFMRSSTVPLSTASGSRPPTAVPSAPSAPSSAVAPTNPAIPMSLFGSPSAPKSSRPTSERPAHDKLMRAGVVKPLGDFDRLISSSKRLEISKGQSTDSERIGRLRPNKPLKLVKLAEVKESGETTLRACVELDKKETDSWRDIYPQSPPWRVGMRATEVELTLEELAQQSSRISHRDGLSGSHRSLRKHGWLKDGSSSLRRFGSAPSARSTTTIGASPSEPASSYRPTRLNFAPIQEEIKREELTPIQQLQEEEQPPDEPSEEAPTEVGKPKELIAPVKKPKPIKRAGSRKKIEAEELPEEGARSTEAVEVSDPTMSEAGAILPAELAPAPAPAAAPAKSPPKKKSGGKQRKSDVKPLSLPSQKPTLVVAAVASAKVVPSAAASQRDEEPDTVEPARELPNAALGGDMMPATIPEAAPFTSVRTPELLTSSARLTSGRLTQRGLSKISSRGWITISRPDGEGGLSVRSDTKEVIRLPPHIRQRHLEQWARQSGLDSHRERDRAMARDEAQDFEQQMAKELRAEVSQRVTARRATSAYLRELERDPLHIGFAYGGVFPGRLHAKGKLHETHQVHFSVGACGRYRLHVGLRPSATEPVVPLPGSPFNLNVVPGTAHPLSTKIPPEVLPLRGALEITGTSTSQAREARCSCTLRLLARDKMGNRCLTGGANVTCGSMDDNAELQSSVSDQGDGEYIIYWWATDPGDFSVFVKMDGLHIIGSPTAMQLTSGTPELSKTEVQFDMLKNARAGKPQTVRLQCKDFANQPAVPGTNVTIGVTLARADADKNDPEGWRVRPSEQLERSVVGDSVEIIFTPKLAGDVKAFFWAQIEDAKDRSRPGSPKRGGDGHRSGRDGNRSSRDGNRSSRDGNRSSRTGRSSTSPQGSRPPGESRRDSKFEVYRAEDDKRKLLPGCPVAMTIHFADVSVKNSYIDTIYAQYGGVWEEVPDIMVNGKWKKRATSPTKSDDDALPDDEVPENSLQVGDTIKIKPMIRDLFQNPVSAKNGSLTLNIFHPSGKESIPMLAHLERSTGDWVHEATYELRIKGHYKLEALLDEVPIPGSPIEWNTKPKPVKERKEKAPASAE